MSGIEMKPPRRLRLRYPSECVGCGIALSKGADAIWDPAAKTVTCLACSPGVEPADAGVAGASAAAEGKRRADRRVEEARRKYGDHAAVVAAAIADQDVQASWGKGSEGESALARYIDGNVGGEVLALHDRLIPGTRTNIDHLWVTPTGVWVVDAKAYKGKVVRREVGPLWRRDNEVLVAGRNRTALANGVRRQVEAVVAALRPDESLRGTDVHAVLCFVGAEWGLLDFPFEVGSVWVMYPGALQKRLRKKGALGRERRERIARRLALSLPPAADG
jgi:nuclease-like protein